MSQAPANPFETPQTSPAPQGPEAGEAYILASRGQRFLNYFIDSIALQIFVTLLGVVVGFFYIALDLDPESLTAILVNVVVSLVCMLGYYVILEHNGGQTLGKMATKTRVVSVEGGAPSLNQIIGRTFSRLVPLEFVSLLGEPPVGWHDSWANTRVVRRPD